MNSQEKKVLIVEDNAHIGKSIVDAISKGSNSLNLQLTTTIAEAISNLKGTNYDLILLDLSLPDGNGLEVLKMLQEKKLEKKVFVFSTNTHLKRICLKYGAQAFFDKATDFDLFISTVKSTLV
ncbi:response regulator [Polaribacter reichenbachii]|uniref:Response regulatory domain-containing protein n=1 Tax=Polaribacter reichenbachii TaxID=996801 RepID=A0A1B8TRU4_9FLAO|nr:response regulator [Polaribacter reichenbachii]APZ47817.1 response regulator [Polaribacter reichenbachii]AUC18452.1 response regulator [Polaribacter reichenbachii]OBY62198.1 hypothetical protein LPB301_15045 [Polaribacter reichenbachii]